MQRLPQNQLNAILISPCCRERVAGTDGLPLTCPTCARVFPVIGGLPVLIDFQNSIVRLAQLEATAGVSPVRRNTHRLRWVSQFLNSSDNQHVRAFDEAIPAGSRILIVGGASVGSGLTRLLDRRDLEFVAFDIYVSPQVQLIADAHAIPFATEAFDAVIVQAVLEHVLDPGQVVAEIWRVLRPGGLVYAETPFLQHVHEGAYDFTRYTHSGHRWLFRDFSEVQSGYVAGAGTVLIWSLSYIARSLFRSRWVGALVRLAFSPLRWIDILLPARARLDGASCLYFVGRKSPVAIGSGELIDYYHRNRVPTGWRSPRSSRIVRG